MAEITRRRTGEFLRELFKILMATTEGMRASEALQILASRFTLTPYEADNYDSGSRRFEKIVRFATVDCVKAGWLVKDKGIWSITDEGRAAYAELTDPESFYKRACKLYAEWKAAQPDAETSTATGISLANSVEDVENTAKAVSVTFEESEEQAWAEISQYMRAMNPYDFQDLVADLLRAMSYHVTWVSPPGKDGGLDVLAWPDALGTRLPRIKVQVKRQQQSVSVDGLRSFMALLGDDDIGLFVCTGGFTKDAETEARTQEKRRVRLIGLEKLFDLWDAHYDKLTDQARRRLPLRSIKFLAPGG
ncbi:Mrr restriction system protein [Rhodoferax sp.]|uniref:restriction endonuclease n=1 Tax=Rhodoferax sp. TaxID=50421 RepID=UPI0027301BAB|nr:Mrr restriction system protein [Rhodoferax sp.]MDP1530340.1 Mrr restriction system protein [Rhodoferax sp.]MDP1943314.1 Mrr restriction system protein [Rhodoferax sp.]MDP2442642.1 Mrr restriction system protein [Rhodoferax sp.]MDZ4209055.1 Mrr restriction system protein [Rhodoferax sp.]